MEILWVYTNFVLGHWGMTTSENGGSKIEHVMTGAQPNQSLGVKISE